MSGFSSEWLALREPADTSARSKNATQFARAALEGVGGAASAGQPIIRALDLGCGTGANVRYLSKALSETPDRPVDQSGAPRVLHWRLVDNDPVLLTVTRASLGSMVEIREADLQVLDESWFSDIDLVSASALLDLVSESWLIHLIEASARHARAVLFALNYDGRLEATPHDTDDAWIRELVNRHQQTDKGFGPALGPRSGERCAKELARVGFDVCVEASDWDLDSASDELQRQLIDGWGTAAAEIVPASADRVRSWQQRRLRHVAAGESRLIVGHVDVAGVRRRS